MSSHCEKHLKGKGEEFKLPKSTGSECIECKGNERRKDRKRTFLELIFWNDIDHVLHLETMLEVASIM